jgi:hypothetical protein
MSTWHTAQTRRLIVLSRITPALGRQAERTNASKASPAAKQIDGPADKLRRTGKRTLDAALARERARQRAGRDD